MDRTLLLVEDDELIGSCLMSMLEENGYTVDWKKTGITGDKAIGENQYALILLDSELPGKSGLELLKHVRRRNDKVPVIVATGRDSMSDKQKFLDAGANVFLAKPFDSNKFLERVAVFMEEN